MDIKTIESQHLSLDLLRSTRSLRATDRIISALLWENPGADTGIDLYVVVEEVTPQHLEPLRRRVAELTGVDFER